MFSKHQQNPRSFEKWKDLDPYYIQNHYTDKSMILSSSMRDLTSGLSVIAWFSLIVPFAKIATVLSISWKNETMNDDTETEEEVSETDSQGTRQTSNRHDHQQNKKRVCLHFRSVWWVFMQFIMVAFVYIGAFTELIARLINTGVSDALAILSTKVNLDDWASASSGELDEVGWRVVEMLHISVRSMSKWIDCFEWICLFVALSIFTLSHIFELRYIISLEDNGRNSRRKSTTFSRKLAIVGLIVAMSSLLEFIGLIARTISWKSWSFISFVISMMNSMVFLPVWLIQLSRELPCVWTLRKLNGYAIR